MDGSRQVVDHEIGDLIVAPLDVEELVRPGQRRDGTLRIPSQKVKAG